MMSIGMQYGPILRAVRLTKPMWTYTGGTQGYFMPGEVFKARLLRPLSIKKGKIQSLGLASSFSARPNGAVAYIGCSTGGQPCALALMDGFRQELGNEPSPRWAIVGCRRCPTTTTKSSLATLKPNADWYPPSILLPSDEDTWFMAILR